jgi:glycosyltransferase involved in cell wall biosynthesis
MIKISGVIITHNVANKIENTLKSLDFCDEIVVCDSYSTDDTIEVCNKYNCRIIKKEFTGFGPYKRFAVEQAKNNWILSIDSDEIISQKLKEEIVNLFKSDRINANGFYIPRSLVFLGKRLRFSGESRKNQLRLFNKNYGNFSDDIVHEKVIISGKTSVLKNVMLHYTYEDINDYFEKFNKYTKDAAYLLFKNKKKANIFKIIMRFPLTFIKIYLLKLGILDGYQGFLWALFSSLYPVVKYAKLKELLDKEEI